MFWPIENGECIEVPDNAFGYIYKCWIPPYSKGWNIVTHQLEDIEVIKRSEHPSEQYWVREGLPADYKERRKKEKERQAYDKMYYDPYLEQIRQKHWKRRLCGVWFWNNGVPVYLTGMHWMYLEHWQFQGKYNDYRRPDRDTFYVIQHNIEDPCCLGTNEIMNRKNGKTSRAGLILYERASRMAFHHASLQSKGGKDAKEMFKKAIIQPWRKMADFFRPIYDLMKGDDPSDELRFFYMSRRGQQAETEEAEEALESWIDHFSADEKAADGPEIQTYVSDETSKTPKDVSIIERQNVVRYCTEIGGVFTGYHHYCTTVEIDEDEEENPEFLQLTTMSNPLEKDENGRTASGLYTYFRPAHHSLFFDKFGEPEIEKAEQHLLNTRRKLQEDGMLRQLSSFKRKQPMTFKEAFSIDGAKSLFNPELLNIQMDEILWRGKNGSATEFGDLVWKDGFQFVRPKKVGNDTVYELNTIEWVPNPKGCFEKVKGWWPKNPSNVYEHNGQYIPNQSYAYRIGVDPFKYDKTKSKRRSNCAAFAYQIPDPLFPNDPYDDMLVLRYSQRPEATYLAHAELVKMGWLCGCQMLFERNFNAWKKDFEGWNCNGFLMWLPGEVEPGIYTDGKNTVQTICNLTESYINKHYQKVFFKTLIQKDGGWLGFKIEDTQDSDEPMAAGFALIAVHGKRYTKREDNTKDIEDILPYRKAI